MIRLLSVCLLLGGLLIIIGSALHPILPLQPAGDLALIARTGHWRLVHLGLLYGTGLTVAGVWARWLAGEGAERAGLGVAFVVLGLGEILNGVNIAYMTGAGTVLAAAAGSGADVALLYDATHAFAVVCGRLSGFLVAVAAACVALATGARLGEPRGLVGLAWLAAGAGLLGNFLAPPGHPLMLTSVGLMAVWQVVTAVRLLKR
jgi:hypothetical protein